MISWFQAFAFNGSTLCRYAEGLTAEQMGAVFAPFGGAVHKLNAVDPQLETARFQPLSLPFDPL